MAATFLRLTKKFLHVFQPAEIFFISFQDISKPIKLQASCIRMNYGTWM